MTTSGSLKTTTYDVNSNCGSEYATNQKIFPEVIIEHPTRESSQEGHSGKCGRQDRSQEVVPVDVGDDVDVALKLKWENYDIHGVMVVVEYWSRERDFH